MDNYFPIGVLDLNIIGFSFFGCQGKDAQGGEPGKGGSVADEPKVTAVRKKSLE